MLDGIGTVNEDTLALDVIRKVGPGGDYLSHDHTFRLFSQRAVQSQRLFKRQTLEEWTRAGKKTAHQAAHERVLQILSKAGTSGVNSRCRCRDRACSTSAIRFRGSRKPKKARLLKTAPQMLQAHHLGGTGVVPSEPETRLLTSRINPTRLAVSK